MFYFSTYCFNCFCLMKVVSSVLLFNLLFQLFLFNEGGEQCFTFQLIVSKVVDLLFNVLFQLFLFKVVSSVLLFNLLFQLFLFNEGGEQCFTFQLIVRIVFCFIKVVSSVLLFYLLFQWLLFNEGCEQCFTFQLIVSIVFVKVVCSVLLFNSIVRIVFCLMKFNYCFRW